MADADYSDEEINEVLDKLQAVARGFPAPTVVAAAAMLIVNAVVQKSPSVEKAYRRCASRPRQCRTTRGRVGTSAARLAAIPAGESPANRGVQSLL
jgi:hypothetical protein